MRPRSVAPFVLLVLIPLLALAARPSVDGGAIDAGRLRGHVQRLASDDLGGRGTGEPGIARAEEYVARQFKRVGLRPLPGQAGYFLDLTFYRRGYDPDGTSLQVRAAGAEHVARAGTDFRPFPFSDEGEVEGEIVFAGYGITSAEHTHDDYAGLDVQGKIVLVLRHEPRETDTASSFDGTESTQHAQFATKASNAREHGARAMLLVTDPLHHDGGDDLRLGGGLSLSPPDAAPAATPVPTATPGDDAPDDDAPFLAVHIARTAGESVVAPGGRSLADLQRALDDGKGIAGFRLEGVTARLAVRRTAASQPVAARDVAGFLEGSDPSLKDEWIVVGAHHDHLGHYPAADGDSVFNGADDNASGTSGLLELARALSRAPQRPRRSIAFITFTGEEMGLLGSRALVTQDFLPMNKVKFMLNLDMIGRNPERRIEVFGDGFSRDLRARVEAANAGVGLPLDFAGPGYNANSDHAPFHDADVPFMFFFTGTHEDYHQLGDHADKLDYARMRSILAVALGVLQDLATADTLPSFIHHIGWLGIHVEVEPRAGGAVALVTAVEEGSRAAGAGLQAGDVLAAFGEEEVGDATTIGVRFRAVEPGTEVALAVRRGEERVTLQVARARVGYLGVFPGPLDDDQRARVGLTGEQGVVLRSVTEDGPGRAAGLQEGDIVLEIGGRAVSPSTLGGVLTQIGAGETVSVLVIRGDEWLTLPVTLGERPGQP